VNRYVAIRAGGVWQVQDEAQGSTVASFGPGSQAARSAYDQAERLNRRPPPHDGWLRIWRKQHGVTQKALAERLEVTEMTIQRWESGDIKPPAYLRWALERLEQIGLH
jgi:DNA-binding transcriptional regulator YiaG